MSPMLMGAIAGGVLLLLLVVFLLLRGGGHNHDCTEPKYLADRNHASRRWFHGALAVYKGDCGDPGYWDNACASKQLSFWGCNGRNDVLELINQYQSGETTTAFDKLRIIWLARTAAGAGWLTVDESWQYCEQAKAALLGTYPNWEAVATDMASGRSQWYEGEVPEDQAESNRKSLEFAWQQVLPQVAYR